MAHRSFTILLRPQELFPRRVHDALIEGFQSVAFLESADHLFKVEFASFAPFYTVLFLVVVQGYQFSSAYLGRYDSIAVQ